MIGWDQEIRARDVESIGVSAGMCILPRWEPHECGASCAPADEESAARLSAWLEARIAWMRTVWTRHPDGPVASPAADLQATVERLVRVLLDHRFNHQSRGRLAAILPGVRNSLEASLVGGRPIRLFLLYNGGYRATPFPGRLDLIFSPDQTELMLLHQISLLQDRVTAVYRPGIEFVIVVNNGVAHWVNDVPIEKTEAYAVRLRAMIRELGAGRGIRLLVQSDMAGFRRRPAARPIPAMTCVSPKEHSIVERFLGRRCTADEARRRIALYGVAEAEWAETLRPIVESREAILLRQVAHPAMLSFRPFPGGAIRAQNGSVGFEVGDHAVLPRLVTSESFGRYAIRLASISTTLFAVRGPALFPDAVDA